MKTVAHFVRSYPKENEAYIREQVENTKEFKSIVLTERLLDTARKYTHEIYYLKRQFDNPLLVRMDSFLTEKIFVSVYQRLLENFWANIIQEKKVSILHGHFGMAGWKLVNLKKRFNIPLVVTFYGVDASHCLQDPHWLTRFRPMFTFADRLIVLCDEVKMRLVRLGCPPGKICLWDIGVDLGKFPYQKRQLRQDNIRFLTVARFVEKKGYPVLLKAFSMLSKSRRDLHLTVVGYGPLKNTIEQTITDLGLQEIVTLIDTAKIGDFAQFYRQLLSSHDIFVLPAVTAKDGDDEGGPPLSLVYAQASGLPVITTPFAGASRVISDNETGLFARMGSGEDLAEKIGYLAENPHLWNKLGEAGSNFVRERYPLDKQIKALEDIYASIA